MYYLYGQYVFHQIISEMKTLQESQDSQVEQITANLTGATETAQTKWRLRTIYILMNVFNQMMSVMKTLQESQESQMEQITANLTSTTETAQANKYFFMDCT